MTINRATCLQVHVRVLQKNGINCGMFYAPSTIHHRTRTPPIDRCILMVVSNAWMKLVIVKLPVCLLDPCYCQLDLLQKACLCYQKCFLKSPIRSVFFFANSGKMLATFLQASLDCWSALITWLRYFHFKLTLYYSVLNKRDHSLIQYTNLIIFSPPSRFCPFFFALYTEVMTSSR